MTQDAERFEIFLACAPGMEPLLKAEALDCGFHNPRPLPGGVRFEGRWREVMRANLHLRGAGRVLVRMARFEAPHFGPLEHGLREVDWASFLRRDVPIRFEATCKRSKLYHSGAVIERAEKAVVGLGFMVGEDGITVQLRLEKDRCMVSFDSSGEPLHRRGTKRDVGKAPMRETLASLFLREAGYSGTETVLDPMCGSGTFVLEAAERALGLAAGRGRDFDFLRSAGADLDAWEVLRNAPPKPAQDQPPRFIGYDRDKGVIEAAKGNADRADLSAVVSFEAQSISALERPEGPPGLVIVNPPYGERIGDADLLRKLYGTFGRVMKERFAGWRVGMITSEDALARVTGLPFLEPGPPVPHGALRIRLWQTEALPA